MVRRNEFLAAVAMALGLAAGQSQAATLAYDGTGAAYGSNSGPLNIGHEFDVSSTGITVRSLGVFDGPKTAGGASGTGLQASHVVDLFSITTEGSTGPGVATVLASVTVPAGTTAPLQGGFRFVTLGTPVFLPVSTGVHYAVIAYGFNSGSGGTAIADAFGNGGSATFPAGSNAADFRYDPYQFTSNAPPAFPGPGDAGIHQSASFLFDNGNTVPEPASVGFLSLAAFGLLARRRTRE